MATNWFWRAGEIEKGPISFRELVILVRDEVLKEDDLVRPHYSPEYQQAASVIGLYHMAGRADVLARWEEESRQAERLRLELQTAAQRCEETAAAVSIADIEIDSGEIDKLPGMQLEGQRPNDRWGEDEPRSSLIGSEDCEGDVSQKFKGLKEQAIAAAIAKIDSKDAGKQRYRRWAPHWDSDSLRFGLQCGLAIVVANVVALAILSWSETEALRFPTTKTLQLQSFPLLGDCSPGVYACLFIGAVLCAGITAFAGTKFLVNLTD